jgi:translation initiation factor 3 subunit D
MIEEFDLAQLLKLQANIPVAEDLLWAGHMDQYDENFDKITTRTAKALRKIENKIFYDVTSGEDPVLEKFAVEGQGDVYATDAIIAQLMAAPRSVYSWDIVIQKVNGMIFLDKRDNSSFDFLTVSETSHDPPVVNEETEPVNYPEALSVEATMINQNFSQQVLLEVDGNRKTFEPNPFFDEFEAGSSNVEPASVAYRYRKFTLGSIKLVTRCELHCWTNKRGEDQLMTCHSLNEWDSKFSGGVNWRQKIDQQRGAVLATELKNNSCKLAKWTAQSILAGAHQMKLGYVSRTTSSSSSEHQILATQFFKPKDLAMQINLSLTNIWGIVKMICELLLSKEDGKYVLLKDPNKPIVRLYAIPLNTFEEEDEVEEEEVVEESNVAGEDN